MTDYNNAPLFIVTGTSGAGKTTIIPALRKKLESFVVYDGASFFVAFPLRSTHVPYSLNWLIHL